jgi:hypothetical protein
MKCSDGFVGENDLAWIAMCSVKRPVAFYSDHTVRDGEVDRCRTHIPRTATYRA